MMAPPAPSVVRFGSHCSPGPAQIPTPLTPHNAVLLPPEDVDAWEAALRAIRSDDARRRELAARARQDAGAYDWKRRAQKAIDGLAAAS